MEKKYLKPVEICSYFLSKNDRRPILQGVHFLNESTIVATDSYTAVWVKGLENDSSLVGKTIVPKTLEILNGSYPSLEQYYLEIEDNGNYIKDIIFKNVYTSNNLISNNTDLEVVLSNGDSILIPYGHYKKLIDVSKKIMLGFQFHIVEKETSNLSFLYAFNEQLLVLILGSKIK